jgi:hypothetical protein
LAQAIFEPNLFPYKYPNILNPSYPSYQTAYEDGTDSVRKCWHIKFRRWGNTQKKVYDVKGIHIVAMQKSIYNCSANNIWGQESAVVHEQRGGYKMVRAKGKGGEAS